jgi:hypothetical protein
MCSTRGKRDLRVPLGGKCRSGVDYVIQKHD